MNQNANDEFLSDYRKAPRPEFAGRLYERINPPMTTRPRTLTRMRPALAAVGILMFAALLVAFPPVQAAARDFLGLFRVKHIAAVPLDPARLAQLQAQLESGDLDLEALLGDDVEILQAPGKPQSVASVEAAEQLAGIDVRVPTWLPDGVTGSPDIHVQGASSARVTGNVARLELLLGALSIDDVKVPAQLDGAVVTINVPATVGMSWGRTREQLAILQARSPEIDLPDGVDMAQLGEIGLRIAGLSADEARHFSQSIDWNSTLIIPIPTDAAVFSEVSVRGTTGLLVTMRNAQDYDPNRNEPAARPRDEVVLLWAEGDLVYAIMGQNGSSDVLRVAESLK